MRRAVWTAMIGVAAMPAAAATQGDSGPRSGGSVLIRASVVAQARIAGPAASPCVTLNTATGGFGVAGADAAALGRCGAAPAARAALRDGGEHLVIVVPE